MPLKNKNFIGQTRVKKQLATQSVFYGGMAEDSSDIYKHNKRTMDGRRQSDLNLKMMLHNPSEISLGGKDGFNNRVGETTVHSRKSQLMRRTRQSTKHSNDDSTIINLQYHGRNSGCSLEPTDAGVNCATTNTISINEAQQ